eukprot:6777148-Pyramimonas_sp.AAC.1
MTKFQELVDMSTQGSNARAAPEAEQLHDNGLLPTIHGESEADLEAHIIEVWHTELQDERELLQATPVEEFDSIPTHMTSDNSALVTVADEQQEHLPARGNPQSTSTAETHHVLLCSRDDDDSYGLDFDEHGHCVELCFTAEMSK